MARCDTTALIDAAPSRVWGLFRPDRINQWYGPEVRVLSPGPFGKGSKIKISGRSGAKTYGYEATVTEYVPNRGLTWEGEDNRMRYRVAFLMTPKDGKSLILMRDEFYLKLLLGRLIEKLFMARRVAKTDRQFMARLQSLAEAKE